MHVNLSPRPPQFLQLPVWFADKVDIDTDRLTIPRGQWLACDSTLVARLEKKRNKSKDDDQVARIDVILGKVKEGLTDKA